MDKEKIKELFWEYWDGIKDKSSWSSSKEEFEKIAYKQVAEELKQGDYKQHIQIKAVEKAKGNKEVIESLYIQFRVSEVTNELEKIAYEYEAKIKAKKRELEAELWEKRKAENKAKRKKEYEAELERQEVYDYKYKSEHDRQTNRLIFILVSGIIILSIFWLVLELLLLI